MRTRPTYLPAIGLTFLVVWSLAELSELWPRLRWSLAVGGGLVAVALGVVSHRQLAVWRDTRTLFTHAAAVTQKNFVALSSLANFDLDTGRVDAAITNLQQVLEYAPWYPRAKYLLGSAYQMKGRVSESIPFLESAGGIEVEMPRRARLAFAYLEAGRLSEAGPLINQFLQLRPAPPEAFVMNAILLKATGRTAEAAQQFRPIAENQVPLQADTPYFNYQLAELHGLLGNSRKAAEHYARAVEMFPNYTNALNDFAWLLASDPDDTVRNGPRAVELAERACTLTEQKIPVFIGTLAAAYAEAGRFDDAIRTAERARDLARELQQYAVALRNADLLEMYRAGKPYREPVN